jgi:hypothetical protein
VISNPRHPSAVTLKPRYHSSGTTPSAPEAAGHSN